MPVIKRYPNRKLYDTEAKQYITLDGIADLIRQGQEIQVIDNATGEDLTAVTLTQIIFEQEKKQSGFLPYTILTSLIQTGGDRLSNLQKNLLSTLGLWHQVDEEIRRRVNALIGQGELAEAEGQRLLDKLLSLGAPPTADLTLERQQIDHEIEKILAERNIPSREDIQSMLAQLETLAGKLEDLGATDKDQP